jgi:tRNA(fMet)-specific endonuclease VapC
MHDLATANNMISVVSSAELYSLAFQNHWSLPRIQQIDLLRKQFGEIDIYYEEIIQAYAKIDAFSQGKLLGRPLGSSSKNMGKNDLWIAATATVFNLTLLTTDADFNHLNGHFLNVDFIRITP